MASATISREEDCHQAAPVEVQAYEVWLLRGVDCATIIRSAPHKRQPSEEFNWSVLSGPAWAKACLGKPVVYSGQDI
jgi:hypothetical protein